MFTSLKDDTYGMGGSFDTSNDGSVNPAEPGQWGGLVFTPTSKASLDYVQLSYAGGDTSLGGDFDTFNAIEIHQADVRIANSVIEFNADGDADGSTRGGIRQQYEAAAIFVRGAQPVIVNNTIIDNEGDAISIDANSLKYGRGHRSGTEHGGDRSLQPSSTITGARWSGSTCWTTPTAAARSSTAWSFADRS